MIGTEFAWTVYDILQKVPAGRAVTYGQLAALSGHPGAARAVGNVLHVNPFPDSIPCFRVVNANGGLARNFGIGGPEEQKRRLEADGIPVTDGRVDLGRYGISYEEYLKLKELAAKPGVPENNR